MADAGGTHWVSYVLQKIIKVLLPHQSDAWVDAVQNTSSKECFIALSMCDVFSSIFLGQATLDLIQRALSTLFTGSVPKPHDLVWSKGQVCIAYYEVDGRWYRGKVTKVIYK